jgi:adenosine deaminase
MSLETIRRLAERHCMDPTTILAGRRPGAISGFLEFARHYFLGLSLLGSAEDLATVTDDLAATLAEQNVRYAEVTSTAFVHLSKSATSCPMSAVEYCDGLNEGRRRAAERGVAISWVIDIPRGVEPPESTVTIDLLESPHAPDGLVALGLGGYELMRSPAAYVSHFQRARAIGLGAVPHAGETAGPQSVRSCVLDLQADRIGHGIRSLEDRSVIDLLVDRDVVLEVCPTSNVRLGIVENLESHPLSRLRDAGVRVCLNTDDPGCFDIDLVTELESATKSHSLCENDHIELQTDALAASFATQDVRRSFVHELAAHAHR